MTTHALIECLDDVKLTRAVAHGPIVWWTTSPLWVDWREDWDLNLKTEAIMLNLEGNKSAIDIAFELELPIPTVRMYLDRFAEAGLIEKLDAPVPVPGGTAGT